VPALLAYVGFSNRPFRVKRFQTIHHYSVDVAHGLSACVRARPSAPPRKRRDFELCSQPPAGNRLKSRRFSPAVDAVIAAAKGNRNVEVYLYPGAAHGFFTKGRPAFNGEAVAAATARIERLLSTLT
jgi:hypothetical protein